MSAVEYFRPTRKPGRKPSEWAAVRLPGLVPKEPEESIRARETILQEARQEFRSISTVRRRLDELLMFGLQRFMRMAIRDFSEGVQEKIGHLQKSLHPLNTHYWPDYPRILHVNYSSSSIACFRYILSCILVDPTLRFEEVLLDDSLFSCECTPEMTFGSLIKSLIGHLRLDQDEFDESTLGRLLDAVKTRGHQLVCLRNASTLSPRCLERLLEFFRYSAYTLSHALICTGR